MTKLGILILTSMALLIAGCASNNDDATFGPGYRTARAQTDLDIPPDLINTSSQAVKNKSAGDTAAKVLPEISGLTIMRNENGERWLEVEADVDTTWAKLVDYTLKTNLPILTQNKSTGIIESDWLGDKGVDGNSNSKILSLFENIMNNSAVNDKFTLWLERTSDTSTSLFVSHRQLKKIAKNRAKRGSVIETAWVETSGDGFESVKLLRNIKLYFGGQSEQDVSGQVVLFENESPHIILKSGPAASRNQLINALAKLNLEILSEKKNKNLMVVREISKKKGLFSKFTRPPKHGLKLEAMQDGKKSKITVVSSGGRFVDKETSLPMLYRLAGALRSL